MPASGDVRTSEASLRVRVSNLEAIASRYDVAFADFAIDSLMRRLAALDMAPRLQGSRGPILITLPAAWRRDPIADAALRIRRALEREPVQRRQARAYLQIVVDPVRAGQARDDARQRPACCAHARAQNAQIAQELLDELRAGHLHLALQPVIRLTDPPQPLYHEALLRRPHHTGHGSDSIAASIVALERWGSMDRLDESVLRTCLHLLARHPGLTLGCNLSARTLSDPTGRHALRRALAASAEHATRLTLEITETAGVHDPQCLLDAIAELRVHGSPIALDDIGSGYSSFTLLMQAGAQVVKISRDMLLLAHTSAAARRSLGHLVSLCADHAPCVVIEGVEHAREHHMAMEAGAHAAQGYYYGLPNAAPAWLAAAPVRLRDAAGVDAPDGFAAE